MEKSTSELSSPLMEIPRPGREAVQKAIQKPQFLMRLLVEEAERLEEYATYPGAKTEISGHVDFWGNYTTVSEDCISKAKYYRRVAKALILPNK